MTDLQLLYRKMCDDLGGHIREITSDQWDQTTYCCPDWSVRDLLNHIVGENKWIVPMLRGRTIADVGDAFEGDLLGGEPKAAWTDSAEQAIAAIGREDALELTVELSSGPATGRKYISEVLSDQVVHTWDLASSIGTDERLDPALVEFAFETLEPLAEMWRSAGHLGERIEVPADADPQIKLLALLGRRARD